MSFLNPMTYVRGAASAGKALAGRAYYEMYDEEEVSPDAMLEADDRDGTYSHLDGKETP